MLSLTRKTDYALLALAALCRNGAATVSARDLASQLGVPVRVLTNILNRLKHEGLIESTRGTKGGYGLALPPEKITLADLIEAVEGPMRLARCCSAGKGRSAERCTLEGSCLTREAVQRLHGTLRRFLSRVTLHDLACDTVSLKVDLPMTQGMYAIPPALGCQCQTQPAGGGSATNGDVSTAMA